MIKKNILLWIAIIVSIITYQLWRPIEKILSVTEEKQGVVFFVGMALFIFLLSTYVWKSSKKHSIPEFVLFALSFNNLIDELFYDPTKFEMNEIVFVIIVFIYSLKLRKKRDG